MHNSRVSFSIPMLRWALLVLLALPLLACDSGLTKPQVDDAIPPPGSRGSGQTDAAGVAVLRLGGVPVKVIVSDSTGAPVGGAKVGATVGKEVAAFFVADPEGLMPPAFVVYPVSEIVASQALSSSQGASPVATAAAPVMITLWIIGGALSFWELYSDPIHHKLVVDDGILKSCIAGDLNDVVAYVAPFLSAGAHVIVSSLSKALIFSLVPDLGLIAIPEILKRLDFMKADRTFYCTVLVGDADFSGLLVILSSVTGGGLLAQDNRTPSTLYFVEPTASGDDIAVGTIRTETGARPRITDMAHWNEVTGQIGNAALSHPIVYAVTFDRLYRLDRATAIAREIGHLGSRGINALAFDHLGNLYAFGTTAELLRIDRESGAITAETNLNPSVTSSGDLVFLPDGRLLGTVTGGTGGDRLVEINPGTGAVRIIGDVGFRWVYGLSFFDGVLWGLTANRELLRLDPETGRGTLERRLAFGANGASVASH